MGFGYEVHMIYRNTINSMFRKQTKTLSYYLTDSLKLETTLCILSIFLGNRQRLIFLTKLPRLLRYM